MTAIGPAVMEPSISAAQGEPMGGPRAGEPASSWTEPVLGVVISVLLAGAAATLLSKVRFGWGRPLRAPGVGEVSDVTLAIAGVSLLIIAYHTFVYALHIEGYRAPMWVVLGVSALVVLGSLGLDALENRGVEGEAGVERGDGESRE